MESFISCQLMSQSEPKKLQRTNSGQVIVFDPCSQTITIERAKMLKDRKASLRTAPKLGSRVDIYDKSRLIATINLRKLGWTTNTKRLFGKCNQILVIETEDDLNCHAH